MSDELYNVVFQGKVDPGADLKNVKEGLARMFGVGEDKINVMFSGKAVIIKKSADRLTAQKYLQSMSKVGAIAQICTLEGKVVDFNEQDKNPQAPMVSKEESSLNQSSSDELSVAPLGEQIVPTQPFVEGKFNTDGMSVAPVGVDVIEREPPPAPFQADLSNLSMAEAGERILGPDAPICETKGVKYTAAEK